jgi:cyclic pyranopterin phosphate synthase
MPEEGVALKNHSEILPFSEIAEIVKVAAQLGITKIRLTGGEPLVRKNIDELVKMISETRGIEEITMTTNGVALPEMAHKLKQAGLNRVNISLDTLDPVKFKKITRLGNLDEVLKGIDAAIEAGLTPVKINFVRIPGVNGEDETSIREFCKSKNLKLRFIRQMNLKTGEFYPVEGGAGGICPVCNRLRLTADGGLVSCLHSSGKFNTKELGILEAFKMAVEKKPKRGVGTNSHEFFNIGG